MRDHVVASQCRSSIILAAHALMVSGGDFSIAENTTGCSTASFCNALLHQTDTVVNTWWADWELVVSLAVSTLSHLGVVFVLIDVKSWVWVDISQSWGLFFLAAHALLVSWVHLAVAEDTAGCSTASWCNTIFHQTDTVVNTRWMDWELVVRFAMSTCNLLGVVFVQLIDVKSWVWVDISQSWGLVFLAAHALLVVGVDLAVAEDTTGCSTASWCNTILH